MKGSTALARVRRGLRRMRQGFRRAHQDNGSSEGGAALIEFAVVFPAQLFLTLALMQFSLLVVGHILVGHAAWAAARAAVVRDVPLSSGAQGDSQTAATDAAALILTQIVPPDGELENASGVVDSAGGNHSMTPPAGNDQKLQFPPQSPFDTGAIGNHKRGAYCLAEVTVDPPDVSSDNCCCARVVFQFPLVIPVVNKFFAHWGPYAMYGVPDNDVASNPPQIQGTNYWYPVITISKTGFVPRNWSKQQ